jgi:hypothetical protein
MIIKKKRKEGSVNESDCKQAQLKAILEHKSFWISSKSSFPITGVVSRNHGGAADGNSRAPAPGSRHAAWELLPR